MKYLGLLLLVLTALPACQQAKLNKLCGKWQGASLSEDGMPMTVPAQEISFEFFNNGYYQYLGNLNYKESGTFSLNGSLLYTLDTLNEASTEKAVQVVNLTQDSLCLRMNAEGKEREIRLFKLH